MQELPKKLGNARLFDDPVGAHRGTKKRDQVEEGVISVVDGDKCTCPVHIGKQRFRALLDTGATVSLVSASVLHNKKNIIPTSIHLKTVSGQRLEVLGQVHLNVKIGITTIKHWFYVVENIENSVILGFDFISKNNAQLNFTPTGNFLRMGQSKVQLTPAALIRSLVRLKQDVILAPQTIAMTRGLCKKVQIDGNTQTGTISQIGTGFISKEPGLMVTSCLVNLDNRKSVPLCIVNNTAKTIKLRRGNVVARFEGIDDEQHEVAAVSSLLTATEGNEQGVAEGEREGGLSNLLHANKDIFADTDKDLGRTDVLNMKIDTYDEVPIAQKPYRVAYNKRQVIDSQVEEMLEAGIIQPSRSPWSSPVVLVKKRDGTERFCVDYGKLNEKTVKWNYPLPHIDDILATLGESKCFSCLDLKSGYWQVEMDPAHKSKTAFVTYKGLYEFNVLPFGLCGAPGIFSELMGRILGDLPFCLTYLDDLIVFSKTKEEHLKHLEVVLERLRKAKLKLKRSKCSFFQEKINYLGHIVSKDGVLPDQDKVKTIRELKPPTCVRDVRSFVGMSNFYRKFVPNYSKVASPLLDLTHKHATFEWSNKCQSAFEELKEALCSPPILAFPNMKRPFIVYCDASNDTIGGLLAQEFDEGERPIQYMSQRLSHTQKKWPILQKEAFAIFCTLEKFRHYLHGSEFKIMTDHKPLQYLYSSEIKNPMVQRWALKISSMGGKIEYIPGDKNKQADFLSRIHPCFEQSFANFRLKLFI